MRATRGMVIATLLLFGPACGDDGGGGNDPDARPGSDAAAGGPTAVFEAPTPGEGGPWGGIPYPNDLYLDGDGKLALTTLPVPTGADEATVANMLEAIQTMDGAGLWSNVYVPIDGQVDPATLDGNVVLLDLDDGGTELPIDVIWRADLGTIVAAPRWGTSLEEQHRYAAYVTDGVKAPGGAALRPAAAFASAIDPAGSPSDPALAAARTSLQPLLDLLDEPVESRLVAATVFRTQNTSDTAVAMRDVVAATPPTVTIDAVYGPDDAELQVIFGDQLPDAGPGTPGYAPRAQPHGNVAVVMHGTIMLPSFLSATPGVDGIHQVDGQGIPVVKGTHAVPFSLALPKGVSYTDLPVVIYVHGIDRSRADMFVQADTAAAHGFATLAIDLPYHGSRAVNAVDEGSDISGASVPDGVGDNTGLFPAIRLFHLLESGGIPAYSPLAMRENLRQAAMETVALVSFVADGDPAPIDAALAQIQGIPDAVTFRDDVALLTESLGATISAVALAVEPRLRVACMTSAAAGFPFPSMIHSPNYSSTFLGAINNPFGIGDRIVLGDPIQGARWEPVIILFNSVLERGEASGYAAHLLSGELYGGPGPSLLMTESWTDEWVPNDATERFAAVVGAPYVTISAPESPPNPLRYVDLPELAAPVSGNIASTRTAGFEVLHPSGHSVLRNIDDIWEYEPGFPPFVALPEPIPIQLPIDQLHAQWSTLMKNYFDGQTPVIIDPYSP